MVSDFAEFIFYAYIPEKTSNDFDKRGSIWTVFLVNEKGDRIDPVELRRIDPITPVITEFFPYIHPHYGIAYRLRFPSLNQFRGRFQIAKTGFCQRDRRSGTEIRRTLTNLLLAEAGDSMLLSR